MTVRLVAPSSSSGSAPIVGSTEPRLWTPPLRELTPETSYGFDVAEFARDELGAPLDPWEEWLAIHAGELLPDGRPRFRIVIVLVGRQNGKTYVVVVLTLYWMWVERVDLVLGTSTKLEYAGISWKKACRLARAVASLRAEISHKGAIRKSNGEQELWRADTLEQLLDAGSRYKIAAANEEGGRSLSIDRAVLDELRQHHDYSAWDAVIPAMGAIPDAQAWALSNAGSDRSVVLNTERDAAERFIQTGEGDYRVGLFEWSSPRDASPLDVHALAQANPNLGRRKDTDALLAAARAAVAAGGEKLNGFKTEEMCIRVRHMDPAIDLARWTRQHPEGCLEVGTLDDVRDRVVAVVDVAIDGLHATLYAAAVLPDGRVRVDPVAAWDGPQCTAKMRAETPGLLTRVRPRAFGWFPDGPAAAIAVDMKLDPHKLGLPDMTIEAIRAETPAVCMGFAEQVTSLRIAQSGDPLLGTQIEGTEKLYRGDRWVFVRKGAGHCDATYAAAGAVHLARTLPPPPPPLATATARR
jgi:hypothetical protein